MRTHAGGAGNYASGAQQSSKTHDLQLNSQVLPQLPYQCRWNVLQRLLEVHFVLAGHGPYL